MGALMLDEVHQVGVLADEFVARRQVHNHVGAVNGGDAARRSGDPQVLTDLDGDTCTTGFKELVCPEGHFLASHRDAVLAGNRGDVARGEPALLVEFFIVGDIGLGYHPHVTVVQHHGAVEQVTAATQRRSHDSHHRRVLIAVTQRDQRLLGSIQQQLVAEEVGTGVTCHTQLGQRHDVGSRLDSGVNALYHVGHIALYISDIYLWHNGSHTHHTVVRNRFLDCLSHILAIVSIGLTCKDKYFRRISSHSGKTFLRTF